MIVEVEKLSKEKYHPFWGDYLKVAFEAIFDRDSVIQEIEPDLIPENAVHTGQIHKQVYHSAIVEADMRSAPSGEMTFIGWADESLAKGYAISFRAKHKRQSKDMFKLLGPKIVFARFNEEKSWSFERGPFMKLETFTYTDPFRTLYVKIFDGDPIYLKVDIEMDEKTAKLISSRVSEEDVPAHLVVASL